MSEAVVAGHICLDVFPTLAGEDALIFFKATINSVGLSAWAYGTMPGDGENLPRIL